MDSYTLLYRIGLGLIFGVSILSFPALFFYTAPYGRHAVKGGRRINAFLGWVLMELPSPVCFAVAYLHGPYARETVPLLFLAIWQLHYFYRTVIYPFHMRLRHKRTLVTEAAVGFAFTAINGFCVGYAVSHAAHLTLEWLTDPRLLFGLGLMVIGVSINIHSDTVLRNLRAPGETGYKIPNAGLHRWVASPNYLGEIIEWIGLALSTWTLAGLAFAVFTIANLFPRAFSHRRWYLSEFPDYPRERKAIIPGVL